MPVGTLNPDRQPTPAARYNVQPKVPIQPKVTREELKAQKKAAKEERQRKRDERRGIAKAERERREENRHEEAIAKINAAGVPQQTLNSVLSGIETLERFATGVTGESDPANVGAPVGTAATPGAPSLLSRLMKSIGLPIIIGLAVTAIWYFVKPRR